MYHHMYGQYTQDGLVNYHFYQVDKHYYNANTVEPALAATRP